VFGQIFAFDEEDTGELIERKEHHEQHGGKDVAQSANGVGEGNDAHSDSGLYDGGYSEQEI